MSGERTAGQAARQSALSLLNAVLEEGRMLAEIAPDEALGGPERARASRLVHATLRNLDRADRVLRPHLRKAPPATVRNALRLATCEMLGEGGAPHGVVNGWVSVLRAGKRSSPYAGLANAVLRKVAEGADVWAKAPVQQLPKWLRGRLISAHGSDAVTGMEAAHAAGAPLDLTMRAGVPDGLEAVALPTGSLRRTAGGQVSELPGFASGDWWVQDAAAAIAARALAPVVGEEVLDLCAAPGGKTMQLAAAGAKVTALDISPARLLRLKENLTRTGLTAEVVAADAMEWQQDRLFDAILLDAPCTATGTIRRHPDLPFIKGSDAIRPLAELQSAMIDRALGWLKPGGRLLFCTCSLLPEEGEHQLAAALERHPDIAADPLAFGLPGVEIRWITKQGGLRLRPDYWSDLGGMDGFFMALLRKPA